jgi:hypothetical protein
LSVTTLVDVADRLRYLFAKANLRDREKVTVTIEFEKVDDRLRFIHDAIRSQAWTMINGDRLVGFGDVRELELHGVKFKFTSRARRIVSHPSGNYEIEA